MTEAVGQPEQRRPPADRALGAAGRGGDAYDALVLAGGAARRLGGADKPGVRVGGRALLDRVLAACAGARTTVVVAESRPTARPVDWAREDPPGGGPLAALDAGVRALTTSTDGSPNESRSGAPSLPPSGPSEESRSGSPEEAPSGSPDESLSRAPSGSPDDSPSKAPSGSPSAAPDKTPSRAPSGSPDEPPSDSPSGPPDESSDEPPNEALNQPPRGPGGRAAVPGLVVVLSADLPFLAERTVRLLCDTLGGTSADGALLSDADGRDQPLVAVYRTSALQRVLGALKAEHGSLSGLPLRLLTRDLHLTRITDPVDPVASFDCDTWDDIAAARSRIREHGHVLDEWITAAKDELGIDLDVDTGVLLDLARDAAHGVARPAAPLTTFLVGYAAAQAGGGPEAVAAAAAKAVALADRWAKEAESGAGPGGAAPDAG